MGYEIRAIDAQVVKELLEGDDAGRPPRVSTEREGAPLRCCLTRAGAGERVALLSYAPLRRWAAERGVDPGAYDEQGPIFVHAGDCPGAGSDGWPAGHESHRMLRAYATDGHILGGRYLAAGEDPDTALREVFEDPETAVVHVRAIEFGCFHFEVRRG
ncbi:MULTISPECIES: DUF1203 domain-containing protein [Streptosporangium]|uniref:DUF1203 domain-containing protein n=1 Tax=Streptosporangium jomthongense TaxID=1193683 RepID=A0ABV8F5P2_9ACTN